MHVVEDDGRKFLAYYERDGVVVGVVGGGMPGKVMKARPRSQAAHRSPTSWGSASSRERARRCVDAPQTMAFCARSRPAERSQAPASVLTQVEPGALIVGAQR